MIREILLAMRPKQWVKNTAVFAAVLFAKSLFDPVSLGRSVLAFVYFCIISGLAYILNDIYDLISDRAHPLKSKRPIASGVLSVKAAKNIVITVTPIVIISCMLWSWKLAAILLGYFMLQLVYSAFLKDIVLLDILSIATSFILRVMGGAAAINCGISSWLLFCTILLSLFISLCKRRHELLLLKENSTTHRKILGEYNIMLLDQLISIATSSSVVCYILYTMSNETLHNFGNNNIKYTTIFVLYGIFRYLYLTYSKNLGGSPEDILLEDKPFLVNLVLYGLSCVFIIYFKGGSLFY